MRARTKLLVVALALGLSAVAVEVVVRVQRPQQVSTEALRLRNGLGDLSAMMRPSPDPVLRYELRRGLDMPYGRGHLVTDAEGVRVPRQPVPPAPPDALRVAVVGASHAFGHRLDLEDAWPSRVAGRVAERRPVELRNFSVPAYNTVQQVRQFRTRVLPWAPDLVLWQYDHRDAFAVIVDGPQIVVPPEYGDNLLGSAALKLGLRWLRQVQVGLTLADATPHETCGIYYTSGLHYDRHRAALHELTGLATAAGVPVVFVVFDAFGRLLPAQEDHVARLHEPLLPELEARGLVVLDLYPESQALMAERGWKDLSAFWLDVEPMDFHPNREGQAWLAARVADLLDQRPDLLGLGAGDG